METNTLEDALKKGGLDIDSISTEDFSTDVGKKSAEIKKELETIATTNTTNLVFAFESFEGEPIAPREDNGTYFVDMLDIDKLAFAGTQENQIRKGNLNLFELQQSIEKVGQIEPIHVVPFGRVIDNSTGLPKYAKYLILDGRRRYEAIRALGQSSILAIVNTTINKQLIDVYTGIAQNTKSYAFSEMVDYANRIKSEQRSMSVETLENFLGYKSGEFLKSLYIDQMKVDYPDIYQQVDNNKLSIEQGFKRLEKEIEKAEKALMEGEMSGDDVEDALRDKQNSDLSQLQIDNHTQDLGQRHILDANLRRSVESRDNGTCQCCGFGEGENDLMGGFNAHHIVPVMYQGPDMKVNLIMLCKNCHGFVHDYENGRFNPDKTTYEKLDWVKKVVVLGNMLRKLRTFSIKEIAKQDPNTHKLLQKGGISLGKAIVKSKISINGLGMFNEDPYQTFMDATEDIGIGGNGKGEFGSLEDFTDEAEPEKVSLPSEDHKPRHLSSTEIHALTKEEIHERDKDMGLIEQEEPIEEDNSVTEDKIDTTESTQEGLSYDDILEGTGVPEETYQEPLDDLKHSDKEYDEGESGDNQDKSVDLYELLQEKGDDSYEEDKEQEQEITSFDNSIDPETLSFLQQKNKEE